MHVLDLYQRPISVRREGSMGTIIYFGTSSLFFFFEKKKKREEKKCGEK